MRFSDGDFDFDLEVTRTRFVELQQVCLTLNGCEMDDAGLRNGDRQTLAKQLKQTPGASSFLAVRKFMSLERQSRGELHNARCRTAKRSS